MTSYLPRHKFLRRNYIDLLHATALAISLPHLSIKLLEIPLARLFLRRATTRPYHFNRDKRRLDHMS